MKYLYILIAILLAVDNVFIRFRLGGISYDRLLEFVLFFLFLKAYLLEIRTNSFFKTYNAFLLGFAVLQLLMNLKMAISGDIEFEEVYTDLVKCFSFLVFSFLFLFIAKKDQKYINVVLIGHFLITLFALLQHPLSPISFQMFEIKKQLFAALPTETILKQLEMEGAYISGGYGDRFRLSGPFSSTIGFSYFAISSFIITFYMYLQHKKKYYLWYLGLLFVASVLTQTRSLLLAEILLVFGYLFFAPGERSGLYKIGLIASAVIMMCFAFASTNFLSTGNSRITQLSSDNESDSRPLLWATGVYTVISYPFGVSSKDYQTARKEMFFKYGHSAILTLPSHNGLINVGFHYSFFGYVVFLFFVLFLLRYITLLAPSNVVFFRLALLAYLVQSSFHNDFILNSDYPFFMVLMLIGLEHIKRVDKVDHDFLTLPTKKSNI